MNNSTILHTRVNSKSKKGAEKILEPLGLTLTGAIQMFISQINICEGLPFEINYKNQLPKDAGLDEIMRRIKKGSKEIEEGKSMSLDEFQKKSKDLCKRLK